MGKLLFDEAPLVVDTVLATKIGVDAALVLQQVHYWIEINRKKDSNFHDGAYWTYNSIKDWNKCFPFYGERTIQRIFKKLKDLGILKAGNFNKAKFDKTSWYTIDYDKLNKVVEGKAETPSRQNGVIEKTKSVNDNDSLAERERQNGVTTATESVNVDDNLAEPIPETSTEINTEINTKTSSSSSQEEEVKQIINFFQDNFYLLKKFDVEVIHAWYQNYPVELIIEAMKIAKKMNARSLMYIERILIDWENEGIKTLSALENYLVTREKRMNNGNNQSNTTSKCRTSNQEDDDDVSRALRKSGKHIEFRDDEQYDY